MGHKLSDYSKLTTIIVEAAVITYSGPEFTSCKGLVVYIIVTTITGCTGEDVRHAGALTYLGSNNGPLDNRYKVTPCMRVFL